MLSGTTTWATRRRSRRPPGAWPGRQDRGKFGGSGGVRGDTRREEPCPGVWLQRRVSRVCPSIRDGVGFCPWGEGRRGGGASPPPLSHHIAILTIPHPARASRSSPAPSGGRGQ